MATSQASKIMIRSGCSSIRTLIHRHLRPTITGSTTAVANLQTGTPENTYNWHYLFPHTFGPCNIRDSISIGAAEYLILDEADHARRKFEAVSKKSYDEFTGDEDDDDSDTDDIDFHEFDDEDDDEDDDGEDLENEDDDRRFVR